MKIKFLLLTVSMALFIISCQNNSIDGIDESSDSQINLLKTTNGKHGYNLAPESMRFQSVEEMMTNVNANLAEQGLNFRIDKLEYLTNGDSGEMGQTIYANHRNLRLNSRWVPNDPRRDADGANITYLIDDTWRVANGNIDSAPSIDSSFETWDSGTNCSNLPIIKRDYIDGMNPNYVLFEGLFEAPEGSTNPFLADIVTTGFLPGFIFDFISEDGQGSQYILGVTWTLIWVDENGPTDIDNNGSTDTALKEVWYNDGFQWAIDGSSHIDIETVALHENGHALELGHFGKIFRTDKNGKFHYSPRAIMNASYSGIQRDVNKITTAAHCSQFGSWPNN